MADTKKQQERAADPSTCMGAYEYMAPKWQMISTLLAGTAAMRAAGDLFLPAHPAEEPDKYNTRLNMAVLFNVTDLTIKSLTGRVFRERIKLNEDVPQQILDIEKDIDSCKTELNTFCQSWFSEAMAKGFAHVFIDMPPLSPSDKAVRTLADDRAENRRPIWSLIKPENLIFAYEEKIDGVDTLTHIRIVEFETIRDGFAEVIQTQIRVVEPGTWEIWINENEGYANRKPKWVVKDSGTYDLPIVPLVTFYAAKDGFMCCKPPMEDLAYLNVRWWQSNADQINILTVARYPMLAASGTVQEAGKDVMKIGPRQLLSMRDPSGRFYYVEHSGKAIESGSKELEKLEDQMSSYGAEFLRRQIAGRTAFERAADGGEATSPLKDMALRFQEAVGNALNITAQWLKLESGGTVTVNTDATEEEPASPQLSTLAAARDRGDISRKTWLEEMIRNGVLNPDLDVEAELAQIKKEGPIVLPAPRGQPAAPAAEEPAPKKKPATPAKKTKK